MMTNSVDLQYFKQGLDCRQVVARELGQPDKAGVDWMWPCPFHSEHTPGGFRVFKDGWKCFSCGKHGDVFDFYSAYRKVSLVEAYEALGGKGTPPDPVEMARRAAENAARVEQELQRKIDEAQRAIGELRKAQSWLRYHEQLDEQAREMWEGRGIPEEFQNFWKLGYDPDHVVWSKQMEWHTPTLSIPIFEPVSWDVINVRHRLLKPPEPNDKYRPERSGLPASLYVAYPDAGLTGKTLLVEGEIKAMVTFIHGEDTTQVVGIPGKTPSSKLLEQLHDCEPIYICLDPDAAFESVAIAAELGKERCRVIELPEKIDDMILRYNLGKDWVRSIQRQAKRV